MTDDVAQTEHPTPQLVAIAPALPNDAAVPVRIRHLPEGIVAVYSPAQETRASVWAFLTQMFGPLVDVTPASVRTAVSL